MIAAVLPPILPETVDENAVRRLCGAAVFAEADRFQQEGHVLSPTVGEHGPEASVRGTWRRVDHVAVQIKAGRLLPTCARDGEVFCRHVGALLLHCLRHPESLSVRQEPDDEAISPIPMTYGAAAALTNTDESPKAELARLLDLDTANHLRLIAKHRGVRLSGSRKADIVEQLTAALAEPSNVDQALAGLSHSDRLALDVAQLFSAEAPVQVTSIAEGTRLFGGADEPPIAKLLDAGLITAPNRYAYGPDGYVVPRTVAARLPTRDDLGHRTSDTEIVRRAQGLGIIETIQVIAQSSLVEPIRRRERNQNRDPYFYVPQGFIFDPAANVAQAPPFGQAQADGIPLLPLRLLSDADLERLRDRTGQPVAAIDFIVRLLVALEIAHTSPEGITIRFDRLQTLLDAPPPVRLSRLAHAWLANAAQNSLDPIFGPDGPIALRWHQMYATWMSPIAPAFASAVRLVARLVGRMSPTKSYDLASFAGTCEQLIPLAAPGLNQLRSALKNNRAISMEATGRGRKQERLVLGPPEGWTNFVTVVLTSLLSGPMTWLGFVDVDSREGRPHALHIRPEAGVLIDRFDGGDAASASSQITVSDDLTVLVPPTSADVAVHGLLTRAGHLVDASRQGLRYQITPAGVQAVFDSGVTGPELVSLLAAHAGGVLPNPVRKEINHWWRDYGTIRLYDEVTIVELSDDFLLAELSAATSFASAILETFSPRLIAIDGARADEIIADLASHGYAPRVIEDS